MNRYSVSDAIFFATSFDKASGHFRRLGLAYVLSKLLLSVVVFALMYPLIKGLVQMILPLESFDEKIFENIEFISKLNLLSNLSNLSGLLFVPFFLAIVASFYRWTLNDEVRRSWLGFNFGKAVLNLFVVYIALFGMFFIYIAIATMLGFGLGFGAAMASSGNVALVVIVSVVAGLGFVGGLFWLSVRLSLAPALTVRDNDIRIFDSFSQTKGHFWKLLGSYLLLYLIVMVAGMVLMLIIALTSIPFIASGFSMVELPLQADDYKTIAALAAFPLTMAIVLGLFLEYWMYMANYGISAYFLRWQAENETPVEPAQISNPPSAAKATD